MQKKVALKRQQAAEDAIALCMAKVTTGQKINRLPPGKIFGMTISKEENTIVESGSSGHFSKMKEKLIPKKECGVSQTSLETLIRLFPKTKLSVLQLVLQRCGQDLLKAIEYFAFTERSPDIGPAGLFESSAFRPPQIQQFPEAVTSSIRNSPKKFTLPPLHTTKSYGDSDCLLNVISEPMPQSFESTALCASSFSTGKSAAARTDRESVALNSQYSHYFDGVHHHQYQQLRQNTHSQLTDFRQRSGILHLPPFLPIIPCVQPNCLLCYKFA
ncbi:uncharacterized protein LOC117177109 isoform X2 [Belonocnema kinseyi]|uniref:uncharacterized protein LOC117177109 isoform X2 n=1 Tax=Belonocnema kinseyi TaxID=2817044 RepID=UPI00143CFF20|nr:uncharacterized protein LOC117177109 isoform X2 [Belonocnema kinseyi]